MSKPPSDSRSPPPARTDFPITQRLKINTEQSEVTKNMKTKRFNLNSSSEVSTDCNDNI